MKVIVHLGTETYMLKSECVELDVDDNASDEDIMELASWYGTPL